MSSLELGLDQSILATKVHRPRVAPDRVLRERLFRRLDRGARGPLTVVSAPTGFGKTTLVADWLATRWTGGSGWVSLGASENDRALFWGYLCTALEQAGAAGARHLLSTAFAPGPVPTEALVAPMLAELGAVAEPLVVALDDLHLIDDDGVLDALRQLVEGSPESVHWMLVSRSGAPFPVGRLRARGRLVEISVDQLRFDRGEAGGFLASRFRVAPSDALVDRLVHRTEGWAAGLRLASLTVGEGDDPESAAAFTGEHPWVTELLVEEVLDHQPPGVRDFLLRTSVLDRFNASLAGEVLDVDDAAALLRQVHRRGLFLVELDGRREWFRYHHLFGEMLRARLAELEPGAAERLHGAASRWFDGEGLLEEAVHHALLAEDPEWAAQVIERGWRRMDRSFRSERWLAWARRIPRERVRERPVLAMGMGWALLDIGRVDEAEPFLVRAQEWLDETADGPGPRVSAEADWRALGGFLAAGWAYLAQARGDLEATERHAREALERLPRDDPFYRGIPAVTVGLAQWARGELDAAFRSFDDGLHAFRAAGNAAFEHGALYVMAEVRLEQGWLAESADLFAQAERIEGGEVALSAEVRGGRAEILVERGLPDEAAALLDWPRGDSPAAGDHDPRLAIAGAELAALRGDRAGARALIDTALAQRLEAARVPRRGPLEARRAGLHVLEGALAEAERWARSARPGARSDELIALADLSLARALRGEIAPTEVEARLESIERAQARDAGPRLAVEAALIRARLAEHLGHRQDSRRLVAEALELAAPDELVRVLHRSAPPEALASALAAAPRWSALRERLDALAIESSEGSPLDRLLTRREREVLGLVREGLRNKDIAKRLFISLSTVKRHIANIYAKLGVTHRTAAVARLEELERE